MNRNILRIRNNQNEIITYGDKSIETMFSDIIKIANGRFYFRHYDLRSHAFHYPFNEVSFLKSSSILGAKKEFFNILVEKYGV